MQVVAGVKYEVSGKVETDMDRQRNNVENNGRFRDNRHSLSPIHAPLSRCKGLGE